MSISSETRMNYWKLGYLRIPIGPADLVGNINQDAKDAYNEGSKKRESDEIDGNVREVVASYWN